MQRKWVFVTNSDFLIPISLQLNVVDILNDSDSSNNLSLKYQRFKPSGCHNIDIRTFKFVVKTLNKNLRELANSDYSSYCCSLLIGWDTKYLWWENINILRGEEIKIHFWQSMLQIRLNGRFSFPFFFFFPWEGGCILNIYGTLNFKFMVSKESTDKSPVCRNLHAFKIFHFILFWAMYFKLLGIFHWDL